MLVALKSQSSFSSCLSDLTTGSAGVDTDRGWIANRQGELSCPGSRNHGLGSAVVRAGFRRVLGSDVLGLGWWGVSGHDMVFLRDAPRVAVTDLTADRLGASTSGSAPEMHEQIGHGLRAASTTVRHEPQV